MMHMQVHLRGNGEGKLLFSVSLPSDFDILIRKYCMPSPHIIKNLCLCVNERH